MVSTLERLRRLQDLIEDYGSDALIDTTVGKLLKLKRREVVRNLNRVREEIGKLEQAYHMSSGDFLARYGSGDLGDDVDYLKWASLLDMERRGKLQLRTRIARKALARRRRQV